MAIVAEWIYLVLYNKECSGRNLFLAIQNSQLFFFSQWNYWASDYVQSNYI